MDNSEFKIRRNQDFGTASLSVEEAAMLEWTDQELSEELIKLNSDKTPRALGLIAYRIYLLGIGNDGILGEIRKRGAETPWQTIRDAFLDNTEMNDVPMDFHNLGSVKWPEGFWKAIIESERKRLL